MSGSGGGGISVGGGGGNSTDYGHGGGFWQAPNQLTGLTNNDLRPRKRRRPVPLLNTTWPVKRAGRRKGATMRKAFEEHLETLKKSVAEIALSGVDNREDLLNKSLDEFGTTVMAELPPEPEQLGEGLDHVAKFAGLLDGIATQLPLIKAEVSEEQGALMERFLDVGATVLYDLVNSTATIPETDVEMNKAAKAGQLATIATEDGEYLVKTELPESYHQYLADPAQLLTIYADLGRDFTSHAAVIADELHKIGELPEVVADEYPELFKAGPGDDENVGDTGDDPDDANDPGDLAGDGDEAASGDTPQNPIEMMVRLASIIVVVGGSILQAQGQNPGTMNPDENDQSDVSGMPDDQGEGGSPNPNIPPKRHPGLMRAAPTADIGEIPLAKILGGDVAVHPSIADALEEGIELKKQNGALSKQVGDLTEQMSTLQATVDRLSRIPAAPKGALFEVSKGADAITIDGDLVQKAKDRTEKIQELVASDPEAASKELLKSVHAAGGRPLVEMPGS